MRGPARALLLIGALALFACSGLPAPAADASPPSYEPSGGTASAKREREVRRQLFVAANVARRLAGRAPLAPDPALDLAAQRHAEDMLRHRYFSHRGRHGRGPARRAAEAGFRGAGLGENLARGSTSASRVVQLWRERSGHRGNLLDPTFSRTGIGFATDGDPEQPRTYWVQLYGR